jgi:hypothetical protein
MTSTGVIRPPTRESTIRDAFLGTFTVPAKVFRGQDIGCFWSLSVKRPIPVRYGHGWINALQMHFKLTHVVPMPREEHGEVVDGSLVVQVEFDQTIVDTILLDTSDSSDVAGPFLLGEITDFFADECAGAGGVWEKDGWALGEGEGGSEEDEEGGGKHGGRRNRGIYG